MAGKITFLKGKAWVQQGVAKNPLDSGSVIYAGDQIRTGKKTNLQMRFLDKTFFALGPEASMNIDSYDEAEEAEGTVEDVPEKKSGATDFSLPLEVQTP